VSPSWRAVSVAVGAVGVLVLTGPATADDSYPGGAHGGGGLAASGGEDRLCAIPLSGFPRGARQTAARGTLAPPLALASAAGSDSTPRVGAGTVRGRVVTCAGGITGAQVAIQGSPHSTTTGPTGAFELAGVPPGTVELSVAARGHPATTISTVDLVDGQLTELDDLQLTDLVADPQHCGRCGNLCPPGAACVYGVCLCPEGTVRCGGTCTTLQDLDHCRACRNVCEAWPEMIPACGAKDCVFLCMGGRADCDNRRLTGCEVRIDSDPRNCGACGNVCAPGQRCVNFQCQ